jgi:beta-galactosidase
MIRYRKFLIFARNNERVALGNWNLVFLSCLLLGAWCLCELHCFGAESPPRERLSFNSDWLFIKGDPTNSAANLDYTTLKPWLLTMGPEFSTNSHPRRPEGNPGSDVSYAQASFDDSHWRKLNLPHDWGIEGPFKQEYPGETGKLPWWGVGWYRKYFAISDADKGKQIYLDVDGAMAYATVWLNGQFVGGWPYGYSSWRLDLTPYIKFGVNNVIAIRLENPANSSRWYPGGGIYRNLWLVKTEPVHFEHWGVFVTTPQVTKQTAQVNIRATFKNGSNATNAFGGRLSIYERGATNRFLIRPAVYELGPNGEKKRRVITNIPVVWANNVPFGETFVGSTSFTISQPKLWSTTSPSLYLLELRLEMLGPPQMSATKLVDVYETTFGIRNIKFTADNGFLLNGERVPLNGVCDHHDLGALGSAIHSRALERQLEILKEMGCNAIRTSHNPPAPELLDLADRLGFVVMDEAFDCWVRGKTRNDYHLLFPDWHEKDMRALVRRDRNHPCVILWSIGNEIPEQGSTAGHKVAAELAAIVHSEDLTRPVTAACNNYNAAFNGFQKEVDVFGYNYKPFGYGKARATNESLPLFGSETASCISSRGEYFFPVGTNKNGGKADFQMSSYDLYAPPWATPPDWEFHGQDEFPYVAGEFVWTGFDYLGEPTPYNSDTSNLLNFTDPAEKARMAKELDEIGKIRVPSRSSYFGIIDLAGFKKDRFYIYQARWRPELPMAHILPHWNWPGRIGQITPVHVYTSGDEAELFLNGKSLGKKKKGQYEYRLRWDDVSYQPGELKVIAYKNGRKWAADTMKTTGPAARLVLSADHSTIKANGRDLSYITVTVADKSGLLVPRSKNRISFSITGPGEIVATDNGNAIDLEPFQSKERNAYNGLALAIIRSTGEAGSIVLKAESPGLQSASVKLRSRP